MHEIYKNLILNSGCDLIDGWAKLNSKNEVSVDNNGNKKSFSAKKVLIAVGGKSSIPDFDGNQYMINSDQALNLKNLPKSIVIYGSGYIAVEFAGIFNGFGVKTNLEFFRSDYVLKGFDYDIRKKLTSQLSKNGIRIFPNTTIDYIEYNSKNYEINLSSNKTLNCDMVMSATGRKPNTEDLGLKT